MRLDQIIPEGTTISKTWGTTPEGGDPKLDKVKVTGVIDFSGLTVQQLLSIASKPVIITYQKLERVMTTIPSEATVDASIALPQTRKGKSAKALTVDEMSDEQATQMLAALQARQAKLVDKLAEV